MSEPTDVVTQSVEYWIRLIVAVKKFLRKALLDILHDESINGLPRDEKALHKREFKNEKGKELKYVIKPPQWDVLCHVCNEKCTTPCPREGKTNSKDLDINIIVVLIRNLTTLEFPKGGWYEPDPEDITRGTLVALAAQLRNEIFHVGSIEDTFTEEEFEGYWTRISTILELLGFREIEKFQNLKSSLLGAESRKMAKELADIKSRMDVLMKSIKLGQPDISTFKEDIAKLKPHPRFKNECKAFKENVEKNQEFERVQSKNSYYFFHSSVRIRGCIYLGVDIQNLNWVAIKRSTDTVTVGDMDDLRKNVKEIYILDAIMALTGTKSHINIIDVYGYGYDKFFYYIISPLYDYTLSEFLTETKPDFGTRVQILQQLLDVMETLHSQNGIKQQETGDKDILLHKDLKPNNIMLQMLDEGNFKLKLIDFGASERYVKSKSQKQTNVGDAVWFPPGVSSDKLNKFTDLHESFVICMLAVYILSNGEHPFVKEINKGNEQLLIEYTKKKGISIRSEIALDHDLEDFFNGQFRKYFPYFDFLTKIEATKPEVDEIATQKQEYSSKLCVAALSRQLSEVHSYRSPNHTRGHRLLALLPFKEEVKKKNLFMSKLKRESLPQSKQNCTTLRNELMKYNFVEVKTKEDILLCEFMGTLKSALEKLKLDELRQSLRHAETRRESRPVFFYLYVLTHSYHEQNVNDVCFTMSTKNEKGNKIEINMSIGKLLNDINECFQQNGFKDVKVVLFYEGCRNIDILCSDGDKTSIPSNVLIFYSTKLDNPSKFSRSETKFATPWYYCEKLVKNIKPGSNLKTIFNDASNDLRNIYMRGRMEEGQLVWDICKKTTDKEVVMEKGDKEIIFLTPDLDVKDSSILNFVM